MNKIKRVIPGLIFTALLAFLSLGIQNIDIFQQLHLNSLIIAILLGLIIKNTHSIPESLADGIRFSLKKILRFAIILLGFKLSFTEAAQIGWQGLLIVAIIAPTTVWFAIWLGKRIGVDQQLSILIGAGTGICGASAVAAVAPVIKSDEQDSIFAIATVTLFGTLAMFLYPFLYNLFQLPHLLYAIWTGASIHEVAQVVAAGFAAGDQAGQFATIVKLARVLLVIPIALFLGIIQLRQETNKNIRIKKETVPWFVFGFLGVFIFNSLQILPEALTALFVKLDNFLLTWAMAGMGLETSIAKMKRVGIKPFYLGLATWIFISSFGLVLSILFFGK